MTERAVLLWIHGGGWRGRASEDGAALAGHGLRVVPARYRLAHEAHWPAQLADVREEARRARDDGRPLLVGGDSAGATLALQAGLRGIDRPDDVAAVLAYWPAVDPLDPEWVRLRAGNDPWVDLLGHPPATGDPATVDATVGTHVGNRVPVLLVHGTADRSVPVSQTVRFTGALLAAGHPVHSWVTHGGHSLELDRPDLRAVAAAFLDSVLPPG
ncbi:alpha/beta hydrolase [Micromonospora sp. U21]|jgi:acetyl esterase|uniref:alpha/beta hydrolase n=1 Tax=Micromonospora sp. U21 TaxID=2824899 RepID=UPI001B388579|nr:alpha/beta hydrolase [Micromonospora sp. U21]MBQ0901898.1 alpha/beta hydrolase [Micromonospora sp. U21]